MNRQGPSSPPAARTIDRRPAETVQNVDQQRVSRILERDAVEIDRTAHKIATACAGLVRTQMRNFYGPIVRLRAELGHHFDPKSFSNALMMHRARVHYLAARERGGNADSLRDWFSKIIDDAVKQLTAEKVEAICDLAEAVVAYHYARKEQDNQ